MDVEPVSFNRGFYTVDMRFFYNVTLQAYLSCPAPVTVEGLCVFDKRAILFGSEGNAKIFSSQMRTGEPDLQKMVRSNLPTAVVEAVDPIVLSSRLQEGAPVSTITEVPACVNEAFATPIVLNPTSPQVLVTLGQFSIIRLERETELLIPVYDYCIPEKECCCSGGGITLSGGELQRVAIALCLSREADLYILDEPSAHLDVEQRLVTTKVIKRAAEDKEAGVMVIDHDMYTIDMISERLLVFDGVPGQEGQARGPFEMKDGMNLFLSNLGITFRRDKTGRPRINKPGSYLDREQKSAGEYYYYDAKESELAKMGGESEE